jgi:hypothetical protein
VLQVNNNPGFAKDIYNGSGIEDRIAEMCIRMVADIAAAV